MAPAIIGSRIKAVSFDWVTFEVIVLIVGTLTVSRRKGLIAVPSGARNVRP